jgi:hypothetical protein
MHWVWELHDDEVMNVVPEQGIGRKGRKDSSHEDPLLSAIPWRGVRFKGQQCSQIPLCSQRLTRFSRKKAAANLRLW